MASFKNGFASITGERCALSRKLSGVLALVCDALDGGSTVPGQDHPRYLKPVFPAHLYTTKQLFCNFGARDVIELTLQLSRQHDNLPTNNKFL